MSRQEETGAFLAAVRKVESGSYEGNYHQRTEYTIGAYQFLTEQWEVMASLAGMHGARIGDSESQDLVATYWANRWHQRYGDWGLVAVAWGGGQDSADRIARRGFDTTSVIRNKELKLYTEAVQAEQQRAIEQGQTGLRPGAERMIVEYTGPGGRWIHPIAGKSEYSNSFRVPRDNKLGIHGAIDVYAARDTPIVSPVSGKVTSVRSGGKGGYTVTILGEDGHKYYFAHMNAQARVNRGDTINAGTHVGYVGNSGNAKGTTPHLHFSMRDSQGRVVNPYNYLKGSVEGGGAFRQISAETAQFEASRSFGDMTTAAMVATGDRIAGGVRTDPRTFGPEELESDEYGTTEPKKDGFFSRINKPLERGR